MIHHHHYVLLLIQLFILILSTNAFTTTTSSFSSILSFQQHKQLQKKFWNNNNHNNNNKLVVTQLSFAYKPPDEDESKSSNTKKSKKKSLHPKIGDIVRYYDLDGGKQDGQQLIGKISFITTMIDNDNNNDNNDSKWLVELNELDDLGDGYYAEYSSRQRMSKKTTRNLSYVSPVTASFVRSENAYKVPLLQRLEESTDDNNKIIQRNLPVLVRQDTYDLEDYNGPFGTSNGDDDSYNSINYDIIEYDGELYNKLKIKLLKTTALTGLAGTVVVDFIKGYEDAIIYFAGSIASLFYLFLLSIKTDTVASNIQQQQATSDQQQQPNKLGAKISNLRFAMPVLVIIGIAIYNRMNGYVEDNGNPFSSVSSEQFAIAIIGFLTYRVPLFLSQIQDAFQEENDESGNFLPGSAGIAMKALKQQQQQDLDENANSKEDEVTVLLISGPQATGRTNLVNEFLKLNQSKENGFVLPNFVDRINDGITFEQYLNSNEILQLDQTGRYGLTKDGIFNAANNNDDNNDKNIVVLDVSVDVTKQIIKIPNLRIIGVWVGLRSTNEFEKRLVKDFKEEEEEQEETKESVIRARMKEIITEIEYGISSGVFEFTIFNDDDDDDSSSNSSNPLKELQEASKYCLK